MKEITEKIKLLLATSAAAMHQIPDAEFRNKPSADKWSKKEILGHLIDSAVNNTKRFVEIQFADSPYQVIPYQQDELVKANKYQEADHLNLIQSWLSLNRHIVHIIEQQTEESLSYPLLLPDGSAEDLSFLMNDYVNHLAHHLKQILN